MPEKNLGTKILVREKKGIKKKITSFILGLLIGYLLYGLLWLVASFVLYRFSDILIDFPDVILLLIIFVFIPVGLVGFISFSLKNLFYLLGFISYLVVLCIIGIFGIYGTVIYLQLYPWIPFLAEYLK